MSQQSVCLAVEGDVLSRGGIVGEKICDNTSLIGAFVSGVEKQPLKLSCTTQMALLELRVALSSGLCLHTWTESDRTCRGERKKERMKSKRGRSQAWLSSCAKGDPFLLRPGTCLLQTIRLHYGIGGLPGSVALMECRQTCALILPSTDRLSHMQPSSSLLLAIATHYDERKISHLNIRRGDTEEWMVVLWISLDQSRDHQTLWVYVLGCHV